MRKHIFFCFALFVISVPNLQAQKETGQFVINVGVGYSPGFNGNLVGLGNSYPVRTILANFGDDGSYNCTSITPNLGGAIDFGILKWISIGLAASYQSETANWSPSNNTAPFLFSDKITRTNLAGRFLFHVPNLNKSDLYFGLRIGESYYQDIPSSDNNTPWLFLTKSNLTVNSFQVLFGLRIYLTDFVGIHFETGIGTPYLAEGGLTFRINTSKNSSQTTPGQDNYSGHTTIENKN
jgi:hypothetical protein